MIDFGLYATYVLLGASILGILLFAIVRIVSDPKAAKTAIIGILGLVALIGICYAFSDGSDATTVYAKQNITESTSRYVGTGLYSLYLLGALTILAVLYSEFSRLFK